MKTIIVDMENFLLKPQFYVNVMKEFGDDEITKDDMQRTISYNGFYFFAFDDNNNVVSWGRCAKAYRRKTMWCIRQIETKEDYRGNGYAGALYKLCEEYLRRKDDARKIYTFVDVDNNTSIRFHEKMGYKKVKKVGKEIRYMHGWDSAIMFEKQIKREIEKEH